MTQDAIVHAKFKFANSKEGFEELLERARAEMVRTGSRGVIFAIETASHYWRKLAYFLDERGIPFRLINPFTLERRREGEDVNRRKNDFRHAEMAAALLHTGKFIETRLPQRSMPNCALPIMPTDVWLRRGPDIRTCLRGSRMSFCPNSPRCSSEHAQNILKFLLRMSQHSS